jgi:hypothetical protein
MNPVDELSKLKELVKQHKVCWEVWPEYHIAGKGQKIQIGFELDLIGTHHEPQKPPTPGCVECIKVYEDLKVIAAWIIPEEGRDSRYEVGVFDSSIHYSPKRKFRGEVLLPIKILHRKGFHLPTDDCEVKCLAEMEEKLGLLGAQKEH